MGEARVEIKLINASDEALVRLGQLAKDKVRTYKIDALVDTGVVSSVLPIHIVQQLGLFTVRKARASYANNSSENIDVTEAVGIEILNRRVTEGTLILGDEVIIGQTALERTDLLVDCLNRKVIPNPAHPDQPVIKIK